MVYTYQGDERIKLILSCNGHSENSSTTRKHRSTTEQRHLCVDSIACSNDGGQGGPKSDTEIGYHWADVIQPH